MNIFYLDAFLYTLPFVFFKKAQLELGIILST